jgi:cytochrome c-type biogenesis protein CcmH
MIWIVLIFAFATACLILRPLVRSAAPAAAGMPELEAYKLQLAELGREEERGTLGKEEAEQSRTEISRRLLRANRQKGAADAARSESDFNAYSAYFALAGAIAIGAAGLYFYFGAGGMPDEPLEARLSVPPEQQPIAIQIANVEHRLRANPQDALGWTVIAPVYFRTQQFNKAAEAYRRAMRLGGEDEDKLLGLFESLTFANDGVAPADAKPALDSALARNPKSLRGRFWQAILARQDDRKADAERIFREMLSENIPDGWKGVIGKQLAALGAEPGSASAAPQTQAGEGGQAAMIRGMVARLAARLQQNGADLDGWLKLIRSYAVLQETDKAQEAAASARAQFASEPQAQAQIEALVRELGLPPPEKKEGQPKP